MDGIFKRVSSCLNNFFLRGSLGWKTPLKVRYPMHFTISNQQEGITGELGWLVELLFVILGGEDLSLSMSNNLLIVSFLSHMVLLLIGKDINGVRNILENVFSLLIVIYHS